MQGEQFAIGEVEVVTATVDLDEVVSWRGMNWGNTDIGFRMSCSMQGEQFAIEV